MQIGNVKIPNNLVSAPMAGISDLPYRRLCKEAGAGLLVTEMVSAKGLLYSDKATKFLLNTEAGEKPVSAQIFGSDPDIMARAAAIVEQLDFDIIDINMGCPAPKIIKNGEGSALMLNPQLIGEIVRAVVAAVKKPVTVKIRKGFSPGNVNAVEVAKIAEDAGAAAITVHGRTRDQFFGGVADWDIIRQVKQAVRVPVIGNGDAQDGISAKKMLDDTGCDGVMVGRAANGSPWVFAEILHYLKTGQEFAPKTINERIGYAMAHAEALITYKGEEIGLREMRKHFCWYIKGIAGSSKARADIVRASDLNEIRDIMNALTKPV